MILRRRRQNMNTATPRMILSRRRFGYSTAAICRETGWGALEVQAVLRGQRFNERRRLAKNAGARRRYLERGMRA